MAIKINRSKVIIASAIALSIVLGGILLQSKKTSIKNINAEKIKNETLLSEKIKLDEIVYKQKQEKTLLIEKQTHTDKILHENSILLEQKELEIKRLNASTYSIGSLKQKISELEILKNKLNADIEQLNLTQNSLMTENERLSELLRTTQNENAALTTDNSILRQLIADNYRVEASKGKQSKPTLIARRAKLIAVSFDLSVESTDNLHFKVIAPDGNEYASINDATTCTTITDNNLTASSDNILETIGAKHSEMIYKPTMKFQKGVYKFNIYNNEDYMGSTQLRLK
jgi:hypothetical protein